MRTRRTFHPDLLEGRRRTTAGELATGAGQVEVVRPRVDDRRVDPATGQRQQFHSQILSRWCRRSPKVAQVLPLLYLHGLSSSDFVPALEELFGSAAGLSASVVTRLCTQWQAERDAFGQPDLSEVDYVYCFADGVLQHPPGRPGPAVLPGHRRGPRRRAKRAGSRPGRTCRAAPWLSWDRAEKTRERTAFQPVEAGRSPTR